MLYFVTCFVSYFPRYEVLRGFRTLNPGGFKTELKGYGKDRSQFYSNSGAAESLGKFSNSSIISRWKILISPRNLSNSFLQAKGC